MKFMMLPNHCEPGWAAVLQQKGIRASYSMQAYGRTRWLLKKGSECIEVLQAPHRRETNVLSALTPVQHEILKALLATGIAEAR